MPSTKNISVCGSNSEPTRDLVLGGFLTEAFDLNWIRIFLDRSMVTSKYFGIKGSEFLAKGLKWFKDSWCLSVQKFLRQG